MKRFALLIVFSTFVNTDAVVMKKMRKLPFNGTEMFGENHQFATGTNDIVGVEVLDFESVPEPPSPSPKLRSAKPNEPDVNLIKDYYRNGLSSVRNHVTNATQKGQTTRYLSQVLAQILGEDNVILQPFRVYFRSSPMIENMDGSDVDPELFSRPTNIVGTLKGPTYAQENDTVFIITAHLDTVPNNPGVDDDGSGVVAVLELARLLEARSKTIPFTIYFVLFDLEEYGLIGSYVFEASYMVPKVENGSINVIGVYNFDMILNYNSSNNTQESVNSLKNANPELIEDIQQKGSKGDFLAIFSRKEPDAHLASVIAEAFRSLEQNKTRLYIFTAPLARTFAELTTDDQWMFSIFMSSDHLNFWYPMRENEKGGWRPNDQYHNFTMTAVMFFDTAFMRGYQKHCYHQPCDDDSQLTPSNLDFFATIIKTADRSIDLLAKQSGLDSGEHGNLEDDGDDDANSGSIQFSLCKQMLLPLLILIKSRLLRHYY